MSPHHQPLVYGFHAVQALLNVSPDTIEELWLQSNRNDQRIQALIDLAERKDVPIKKLSKKEFITSIESKQIPEDYRHQGVIAFCHQFPSYQESDLPSLLGEIKDSKKSLLLLILDGVQDPHNLGACLRTANVMGVDAVIAPKDRAVGITPTVRKVACGAATLTPFIQVTNLARTLRMLKERGIWIIGTDAEAEESIINLDLGDKIALVMGSEGKGLRRLTREHCDLLAHIPIFGVINSLNVSVATAICLYEVRRKLSSLDSS